MHRLLTKNRFNPFKVVHYDTNLQQGLRADQASEGHVPIKRLHLSCFPQDGRGIPKARRIISWVVGETVRITTRNRNIRESWQRYQSIFDLRIQCVLGVGYFPSYCSNCPCTSGRAQSCSMRNCCQRVVLSHELTHGKLVAVAVRLQHHRVSKK